METTDTDDGDIDRLIESWLTLDQAATLLQVSRNKVRQLAKEREIIAIRTPASREPRVPVDCIDGGKVVKGLAGTLVLLADSGFDELESAVWIFTADESLPGRPIDALRENRPSEVRRRAQALAF